VVPKGRFETINVTDRGDTVPGENNGALSRIIQIRVALSIAQYRLVLLANRVIEVTKIKDKQISSKH